MLQLLQSVRVVLVAPKTPANIGAVARVCANFEAPELWLVAPRCDPADGDIVKVSCWGLAASNQQHCCVRVSPSLAGQAGKPETLQSDRQVRFTAGNKRRRLNAVDVRCAGGIWC